MREHKFRAWNTEEQRYVLFHPFIVMSLTTFKVMNCIDSDVSDSRVLDHIELEQYTGVKDKNGVEVYPSDIINCNGGTSYFYQSLVVQWDEDCLCWCVQKADVYWMLSGVSKIEVIGNIRKNPELMDR